MLRSHIAHDCEEFAIRSNGGDWLIAWHSPVTVPAGKAHGANAFCVTDDDGVVLISNNGERWRWPGGSLGDRMGCRLFGRVEVTHASVIG